MKKLSNREQPAVHRAGSLTSFSSKNKKRTTPSFNGKRRGPPVSDSTHMEEWGLYKGNIYESAAGIF